MNDLIDREALKEAMLHETLEADSGEKRWDGGCWIRYKMFERVLASMPSVQPEQKRGKWIIKGINKYELSYGTVAYEPVYRCSVCERLTESYLRLDEPIMPEEADFPRFCPWCGADMRGEKQDG